MPTRRELANAIRALSMDAVQKANSGHPGAPMGMADIAEVLWRDVLKFNPGNPTWWDRDRFVLSNGHASMLLYSVLHLTGYPLADGGDQEFPAVRLEDRGPSGARGASRHRDHHRAAGPGICERGRHGAGRAFARGHLQPARPHHHRPSHLCVPGRRLHDGRDLARGRFVRRHAEARQAHRWFTTTTAFPSTARWSAGSATTPPSASRPMAGMCMPQRRRPEQRCRRRGVGRGAGGNRPTLADLRARPSSAGARRTSRAPQSMHGEAMGNEEIAATRRKTSAGPRRPSRSRPTSAPPGTCARRAPRAEQEWRGAFRGLPSGISRAGGRTRAAHGRRLAGRLRRPDECLHRAARRPKARRWRPVNPRRPRLNAIGPSMPELLGGSADLTPSNGTLRKDSVALTPEAPDRQLPALRRARIRHVGHR